LELCGYFLKQPLQVVVVVAAAAAAAAAEEEEEEEANEKEPEFGFEFPGDELDQVEAHCQEWIAKNPA